ncbi:MAG: HAMP domain-containing protein [Candidatus Promineofilum sp.]|nr:HAMP domain-containing protein [Promineifilum sp.]
MTTGLWLIGLGLLAVALGRSDARRTWQAMGRGQWSTLIVLCGAALFFSQLFPLTFPWINPILREYPATGAILLLSAVPYLVAGALLNVPSAILVGMFAGIGRVVGQTGEPLDVVAVALAAGLSAIMMRQIYAGRGFDLLRRPLAAGVLGRLMLPLIGGLALFAHSLPAGVLGALDLALYLSFWSALPALVEGAIGGAVAMAILWIVPHRRPEPGTVPSPLQRSLQRQLVAAFLAFATVVVFLSASVAFYFSARATGRALTDQMVNRAETTAARLGSLQRELAGTLVQFGADPALATENVVEKSAALGRIQATRQFDHVRMLSASGEVFSDRPAGDAELTEAERVIAAAALAGETRWAITRDAGESYGLSLAVPGANDGPQTTALLATVLPEVLSDMWIGLSAGEGHGSGFLVNEASEVLAADGKSRETWSFPTAAQTSRSLSAATGHTIYESRDPATGARQLAAVAPVSQSGWKVVATMPRAAILGQTLSIIGPLTLLLMIVSTLFYAIVAVLGRDITRPIAEISRASRAIAGGGGLERPVRSEREDEIGQLTLAFSQMQRALRQRLDELSLVLSVSNDVAATLSLPQGMTAVLQGLLRGTGAAGARAVVRNPATPAPLIFAEGPAADGMSIFDRAVLLRLRAVDELSYGTAAEIEEGLAITSSPVAALYALPLRPGGEFQGVLYVAFRQPHYFDSDERNFLRTLAGQATVLVQNAHLFVAAEGGRRRLAAILASTTNGVLVTDQTDRMLLMNPAAERALGIRARDVGGRPVVDALAGVDRDGQLARHLSLGLSSAVGGAADGKIEVIVGEQVFLAGISTVYNHDGQTMGRVAVLQDVTDIRELDRLKSDFVAGISHDLLSPLTYMHNYAATLPIIDDPALEKEYAEKILAGIDRMKRLVNDLLDLARIEAGLNLQFDRINVAALLDEIVVEYASPAHVAGVSLVVEAPIDLPPLVADPALLRRAITNLVTNALKHAPQSGRLTLKAEVVGRELVITVRDRGPGIAAADQAHLFEKFYRGQALSTVERGRGSGLGLAIVKSVADHHHGRVWCESRPGEGSAFSMAIPLQRS